MTQRRTYNMRKFPILNYLIKHHTITALELMEAQNISRNNSDNRLWKMQKQGYLLLSSRGRYRLSAKGTRIRTRLMTRWEIEHVTGEPVSLNFNKPVPHDLLNRYQQITGKTVPQPI